MRYAIVDLEATCWDKNPDGLRMEIIEIGAVMLASATGPVVDEYTAFVRPAIETQLSEFCQQLTTISQDDVDSADGFPTVFPHFMQWIGEAPFTLCSWGGYDLDQFRADCEWHTLEFPATFESHVNLKKVFAKQRKIRQCGMARALKIMNIPLAGQHHRGIDDARNIAELAQIILPDYESRLNGKL